MARWRWVNLMALLSKNGVVLKPPRARHRRHRQTETRLPDRFGSKLITERKALFSQVPLAPEEVAMGANNTLYSVYVKCLVAGSAALGKADGVA